MGSLFVPLIFVCWINGECVSLYHQDERFEKQTQCEKFLEGWSTNVIDGLFHSSTMPFSFKAEWQQFPDGVVPRFVFPKKIIEGVKT